MSTFDTATLPVSKPVVLELIQKLEKFEDAAQQLDAAEAELEDVLTTLYIQHLEETVNHLLDQVADQTGLPADSFKPQQTLEKAPYIG